MAQWWGIALALLMLQAPLRASADWTLVVAHSNDLWYQLDEIQGDNTPCYEDLPPITTTTLATSTTEATTTTSPTTATTTTPPTTATTTTPPTTATTTTAAPSTTTTETPVTTTTATTTTETPATTTTATTTTRKLFNRKKRSSSEPVTSPMRLTKAVRSNVRELRQTQLATNSPPINQTIKLNDDSFKTANSTISYFADQDNSTTVTTLSTYENKSSTVTPNTVSTTTSKPNSESPKEPRSCYGGVPRHLTKVTELKSDSESKNKVFLHLNAGGMLGGLIWYPILGSGPVVESIKTLNYNAVALGYRDFEEGVPQTVEYLKALKNANVSVLCANMDVSREPSMKDLFKKSMVIDIGGRKIGIIGYIGQDADYLADTGKIVFTDPVEAIENEITSLYNQKVFFIIALGSAGFDNAQTWMSKAYNVDLFVNGGSNTLLYNGDAPLGEKVVGPYPMVSYSQSTKRLFVQTSRYGKYLGKIEMDIKDEGRINDFVQTNPIILDSTVNKEPNLQYKVDEWERQVLAQANETIGYSKIPIISDRKICWYTECTGAALMADAARAYLEKYTTSGNEWSNTVAATVWHGGALSDTDLDIGAGPITFGDILTMFPYANVLVNAAMYGQQIRKLFEESVSFYNDTITPNRGEFLHVSGMRVEYDLSKPSGLRVASIYIRDTGNFYGGMAPLQDGQLYRIGMPSFIANGGSRFQFMENVKSNSTGVRDEIILKEYIKKLTPLTYGNEGRVKFTTDPDTPTDCPTTNVTGTVFLTIFLTLLFSGMAFAAYKYLWPKLRDRRGSLLSLVRMSSIPT